MPSAAPTPERRASILDLLGLTSLPDHPDAVLIAAIERYTHLRDLHHATPRSAADGWREMDALEAEIGRIPAATALGARAKLDLALDLIPKAGPAYAIPVSALRDFLAAMDAESGQR